MQGDDYNEMNEQPILLSQEGNDKCPVNSYKLYMSKLSELEDFFQIPTPTLNQQDNGIRLVPPGKTLLASICGKYLRMLGCQQFTQTTV